jgi:hypothetical protein
MFRGHGDGPAGVEPKRRERLLAVLAFRQANALKLCKASGRQLYRAFRRNRLDGVVLGRRRRALRSNGERWTRRVDMLVITREVP